MNWFKSKEYKEGWQAGKEGKDELSNPYKDEAMWHNIEHGMGASPWWDTNYKPFIEWDLGRREARQPMVDEYLDRLAKHLEE